MQEFKAKAKTTQKMTRDGVVEINKQPGNRPEKARGKQTIFPAIQRKT